MSNQAAVKLVLENMQLLEQTVTLINGELSEIFFNAVNDLIKETVETFEGEWKGVYDFYEDTLVFAPQQWQARQSDDFKYQTYFARYELNSESNIMKEKEGNNWWLSNFLDSPNDNMVFSIYPWYASFGKSFTKAGAKTWKAFAAESNQKYPQIEQAGFKFQAKDGSWYIPIAGLDATVVAENYTNNTLRDALTPISDALEKLKEAHPYFAKIVQEAIEKFGKVELDE